MNICIFPGTFNPIHSGHIAMAQFALDKYRFDKIIFIPSYIPPHKNIDKDLATHRFNMVQLALADYSQFEVSDIEYKSEGKSYSLITVKKIIEQYQLNSRLNFIIGTDAFEKIDTWYEAGELKKLVHFIVFNRNEGIKFVPESCDYEMAGMDFIDISSTEIREGKYFPINKNVEDYIKKHGLYKI